MKGKRMDWTSLLFPGGILVVLVVVTLAQKGTAGAGEGVRHTAKLLASVAPNLAVGFLLAGFLNVILPQSSIARWIGEGSGLKGLLIGSLGGALTPGGPFTHFPIVASLLGKGAAIGPICAYISAWALLGVNRIVVWEGPILGWRFVTIRVASCLLFPPLAGLLAHGVASLLGFVPERH